MHWQVPGTGDGADSGAGTAALAARMEALAGLGRGTEDGTGDALPPSRAPVVQRVPLPCATRVRHPAHPKGRHRTRSSAQSDAAAAARTTPRTLTVTPVRPEGHQPPHRHGERHGRMTAPTSPTGPGPPPLRPAPNHPPQPQIGS